ncbi:MAG: hypothetical protein ACK56I_32065, partial [bacterium]
TLSQIVAMKVRNAAPAAQQQMAGVGRGEGCSLLMPNRSAYSGTLSQIVVMKVLNAVLASQQGRRWGEG